MLEILKFNTLLTSGNFFYFNIAVCFLVFRLNESETLYMVL